MEEERISFQDASTPETLEEVDSSTAESQLESNNSEAAEKINIYNEEDRFTGDDIRIYNPGDESFHSEGYNSVANGRGAHAEGDSTKAIGESAHAEGTMSRALGFGAHAEGILTYARENGAHAEGIKTNALQNSAHAEGNRTNAEGFASHAEGFMTTSNGLASHSEGYDTNTMGLKGAHIIGKFGDATHQYSWHLANGVSDEYRGLGARIQGSGFGSVDLSWLVGNRGYAEMFETVDGESIEPGYFVSLEGDKVRKANKHDEFILGVTCANPGVIGNGGDFRWKSKYETDEWGRIVSRSILVPAVANEEGDEILPEHYEVQPQLNPEWNSSQEYVPRLNRPEWVPVILIGCVLVRDNGECRINGYCRCNNGGFGVPTSRGYRVLERTGEEQILILIK